MIWLPITQFKPTKSGYYLIRVTATDVRVGYYNADKELWEIGKDFSAWCELPVDLSDICVNLRTMDSSRS